MNSFNIITNSNTSNDSYDFLLCALGFESRGTNISKKFGRQSNHKVAYGFIERNELSYQDNKIWFNENGFEVESGSDEDFRMWFSKRIITLAADTPSMQNDSLRILIDISCFNRTRLAYIVYDIMTLDTKFPIQLDFKYTLAEYSPPRDSSEINTALGPVSSHFAGWTDDLDKGPSIIVGLGYEEGRALGAVEYLQTNDCWVFFPDSPIVDYNEKVKNKNDLLLKSLPSNNIFYYPVISPAYSYKVLESLVTELSKYSSPILVPLGPKIFYLCTLLIGCRYSDVSVWRVSADQNEQAIDRIASAYIIDLSIHVSV